MGALKMDSASLRNLGEVILRNASSFEGLISNFKSASDAITAGGTWDGEDSVKFNEACARFKADLDRACAIVNEVGGDLVKTANDYDDTQSGVSNRIGTML